MLRWGILSTGVITRKFADTLNQMKGEAECAAVASRNLEIAKAFANEFNIPKAYGSYEELCQDKDIDIIYIGTPNSLHFENTMMCLEHGKHVLCEKPFTTNVEDARKLYDKAAEKKLFLMDALWTVHLPLMKKLKQIIEGGEIGEVRHLRSEYGFTTTEERRSMKLASELGAGALLDIGVYNIGFAKMVMNDQPIQLKSYVIMDEFQTDEYSTIIMEYPNKRAAQITTAIGMRMPTEGVIFGTKGRIVLPSFQKAEEIWVYPDDKAEYRIHEPFDINGFEYQIREADTCIQQGKLVSDTMTRELSLSILETMDQIRKSWGMKFSFE